MADCVVGGKKIVDIAVRSHRQLRSCINCYIFQPRPQLWSRLEVRIGKQTSTSLSHLLKVYSILVSQKGGELPQ